MNESSWSEARGRWGGGCAGTPLRGCDVVVNDIARPLEGFPFEPDLAKGVREADVIAVLRADVRTADVLRSMRR